MNDVIFVLFLAGAYLIVKLIPGDLILLSRPNHWVIICAHPQLKKNCLVKKGFNIGIWLLNWTLPEAVGTLTY